MSDYKPAGAPSVSPYLVVDGATRTLAFLVHVFGAERTMTMQGDDGAVRHAEVRIDDSVVMLADCIEGWPAVASHVHVYVSDVDAVFRRAIDAGATSVQEPARRGDPDRRGGFRDAGGTTWWVATRIGEAS